MKRSKGKRIRGSGGDGGSQPQQHIPAEASDSLQSQAFLRLVDLISEGEIEGLVDGNKSIYLDETAYQNADGSYNFAQGAISWEGRPGTQSQSYLNGFSAVENEVTVSVEVKNGGGADPLDTAIVRQITNPNVNRVRVRVMIPQLTTTDPSTGDVNGSSATVALYIQPNGGSFTKVAERNVSGKSSSRYEFALQSALTGNAPWNVAVVRESADSTLATSQNKTFFESYTEVIDAKLKYPNSAVIGMRIDAQYFNQVPARYYDVKLLKIKLPSNYNPTTRTYTGTWDGTFQVAWSDNPAWIYYDIATNERYGLGSFIPEEQIDKWALYEIGKYCDELVPNGFGSTEPRFTCNLMLANRGEAYTVMQSLASVFRGMTYWSAGAVTVSQDSPQDASYLFTRSNVVNGKFTYEGASAKARHTVALVTWNDPSNFYKSIVEYVEDQDGIAKFGIQQTEITAFGCTSRGQAHRVGKWLLYTEQNESELVTFQTGLEGMVGRPGQIIKVADPLRAGVRMGGRISTATTDHITIDQDITGAINGNTLSCLLPDGTVQDSTVIGYSGRTIQVQPAYGLAPAQQSVWILKSDTVEPQTFRIIGVKEEDRGIFTITALKHDPDKFAFVEQDLLLEPKSYTILTQPTASPTNLTVTESLYQTGTEVKSKATVSWDKVNFAVSYIVRWKRDDDNFVEMPENSFNDQEILDTQPGTYTIQVAAINSIGKRSAVTETTLSLYGKLAPPASVQGFSMIPNAGQAYLTWLQATDLDVVVGGQVRIRWTPRTTLQKWSDAVDIIPAVSGTATSALAPLLSGTYMAKFMDSSGKFSDEEALIITTVPYALALNVVQNLIEDPSFSGTFTNMDIDEGQQALVLADGFLFDDLTLIDDLGTIDFPGRIAPIGTYDFAESVDLGGVWPINFTTLIDLEAFDIGNVIDSRVQLMDDWPDIDGSIINDVSAELYIRHTDDDPAGIPSWSVWKRIAAGSYSARGFQFQLRCTSGSDTHNIYIKQLRVVADMDDRTINSGAILTSGTGSSYRVTYPEPFFATPVVAITGDALNSGDYYTITSSDTTGFNIVFKNSLGTIVSRTFNYIAKGYGRLVA